MFVIRVESPSSAAARPPLLVSVLARVVGAVIPKAHSPTRSVSPCRPFFAFWGFVVAYLVCVEIAKYYFFRVHATTIRNTCAVATPIESTVSPPVGAHETLPVTQAADRTSANDTILA